MPAVLALLVFLGTATIAVRLTRNQLGWLSWQSGIPIFYLFFFGICGWGLRLAGRLGVDDALTADAFIVASVGLVAHVVGATLGRAIFLNVRAAPLSHVQPFRWLWKAENVTLVTIAVFAIWPVLLAGNLFNPLGVDAEKGRSSLISIWAFLASLCLVTLWQQWFQGIRAGTLAFSLLILLEGTALLKNSKSAFLFPFVYIVLARYTSKKKLAIGLVIGLGAVYVFVLYPLISVSRLIQGQGVYDPALFASIFGYLVQVPSDLLLSYAGDAVLSLSRGLFETFATIVHSAGDAVPFYDGRTISEGVLIAVPSLLYPDKPSANLGNIFAVDYSLVPPTDDVTNISPTFMGEFFMNYGFVGVALGMMVIGFLAHLVDRFVVGSKESHLYPIFVVFIGWQEGYLGHSIFPFIPLLLAVTALLWLLLVASTAVRAARR